MTQDQLLSLVIRSGAFAVWALYLIQAFRDDAIPRRLRLRAVLVLGTVVLYTGTQAWRAVVSPVVLVEFTVVSAVALIAGIAAVTTPRR